MTGEGVGQSLPWVEQFKISHPIETLPQEVQGAFTEFLAQRTGIRDYYTKYPNDRTGERIGAGNSAKEDLVDLIATTRVRNQGLRTGSIDKYEYDEEQKRKLEKLDKDQLVNELDLTTEELFDLILNTDPRRTITLPYGKSTSLVDFVWGMERHETLHLGFAIKFGDQFGIQRQESVSTKWGQNKPRGSNSAS